MVIESCWVGMRLADALVIVAWSCLALAGLLFALMLVGVLLIADKPAFGTRRYLVEVGSAWAMLLGGLAAAALGAWMARRRWRARH